MPRARRHSFPSSAYNPRLHPAPWSRFYVMICLFSAKTQVEGRILMDLSTSGLYYGCKPFHSLPVSSMATVCPFTVVTDYKRLTIPLALRLVDNKAILYFDIPTTSDALTWARGQSLFSLTITVIWMLTICSNQYAYTSHLQIILRYLLLCLHFNLVFSFTLVFRSICVSLSFLHQVSMRIACSFLPHSLAVHLHFAITGCHSFAAFVSRFSFSDPRLLVAHVSWLYKVNLHCGVIHESCDPKHRAR